MGKFVFVALAFFLLGESFECSAKVIVTWGETVHDLGPVVVRGPEVAGFPANAQVGYQYTYFGIFWLDLWCWDGEYCLHNGIRVDNVQPINKEAAARLLGKDPSDIGSPIWYHVPPGLCLLLVIGTMYTIHSLRQKHVSQLGSDPRYQHAYDIYTDCLGPRRILPAHDGEPAKPAPNDPDVVAVAREAALDYLTKDGIDRRAAERNFDRLVASGGALPEPG